MFDRIDELAEQYSQLEDEFRLALQLEASRFQEVIVQHIIMIN